MAVNQEQVQRAKKYLELHHRPEVFILPNAWDVGSAKVFELAGFEAIGTTSAGISTSLGYPDGEHMTVEENVSVVRRIARNVVLPVSADMEAGYSDTPEGTAESARMMIRAGVVGVNLEDGKCDGKKPLLDIPLMVDKIRAIREAAEAEGIHLVINARTDVYLVPDSGSGTRYPRTIQRAAAYLEAGADCIFVPDVGDLNAKEIGKLVNGIDAPLNIIAGQHTPSIAELQDLGVSRVSLGPRPMRALLSFLRKMVRELIDEGTYRLMTNEALTYSEVNGWFSSEDS